MIKPGEISKIANQMGIRDTQVEKDYVIGWVLKGISNNDYLKEKLIFKGGTALRKIYFPDFRLSEDLDFTYNGCGFDINIIKKHFEDLNKWVYTESRINLNITSEEIFATGNYNFYLSYTGPLGGTSENKKVKIDIANDELLCNDPVEMNVINEYTDLKAEFKVVCYTLNEIIPEKMRSLMQRTAPRDLYDLWYLFENENLEMEDYILDFKKKAELIKLNPAELLTTVDGKKERYKKLWVDHLANQLKEIPDFDKIWRQLGKHWRKFEKSELG